MDTQSYCGSRTPMIATHLYADTRLTNRKCFQRDHAKEQLRDRCTTHGGVPHERPMSWRPRATHLRGTPVTWRIERSSRFGYLLSAAYAHIQSTLAYVCGRARATTWLAVGNSSTSRPQSNSQKKLAWSPG